MFKAKLGKAQKEILFELLKQVVEINGTVTDSEKNMMEELTKTYHMKNYEYQNLTKSNIRAHLEDMKEKDVLNILTHCVLFALQDGEFENDKQEFLSTFFYLLSIESSEQMQHFIAKYSTLDVDDNSFFYQGHSEQEVFDESVIMMNKFSADEDAMIDESKLNKMQRGPIKNVWEQVMKLFTVVMDPKSDKAMKAIGIGALLYLISPIDAIPDIIPMLGLTDDVSVILYAVTQLNKFIKKGK